MKRIAWLMCFASACLPDTPPETPSPVASADVTDAAIEAEPPPPPKPVPKRVGDSRNGSTIVIVDVQGAPTAVAIDPDGKALRVIGLEPERAAQVQVVPLDGHASQLVADKEGRVLVAMRDTGVVVVFNWNDDSLLLQEASRFAIEKDVVAIALSLDELKLATISAANESLELVAIKEQMRGEAVKLPRSPRFIVADGDHFVVSHSVGGRITRIEGTTAKPQGVSLVRTDLPSMGPLPLLHQTGVVAIADDLFLPGVLVATGDTTVRTKDGYGHLASQKLSAERFAIARISKSIGATNPLAHEHLARAGMPVEGCLLPRAAVAHDGHVFFACAGPGRLFRIDVEPSSASWTAPVAIPDGVTGLAIDVDGKRVIAWSGEDASLAMVPIDAKINIGDAKVARGGLAVVKPIYDFHASTALTKEYAHGRALFYGTNNPAISRDGRTCASCHVDGADDGLTCPTPEGPRQTPPLAGRVAQGAPYGWTGKRRGLAEHVAETIRRLDGRGLAPADRDALLAFLKDMPEPAKPRIEEALVEKGREIFESKKAECATCHNGTMLADGKLHAVKSQAKGDLQASFDTPSLVSVGRSGPFFHDGRYATLRDLLKGVDGSMGKTKHLSPEELDALEAYIRSR